MQQSSKASFDDAALIRRAAVLISLAQRLQPRYAIGTASCSTYGISELLRRSTCKVYTIPARAGAKAIVTPPIGGRYRIGLKEDLTSPERMFALRHELAHVFGEDAEEPTAMVDRGYLTQTERLADLFALADLVPTCFFELARRARFTWGQVLADLQAEIKASWGPDWMAARIEDRARLRVRLFREQGV